MVQGVTDGFEKRLEIVGRRLPRRSCGAPRWRSRSGFSHPVTVEPPDGISFEVPAPDADRGPRHRQAGRGQVAAEIRAVRPPEPYKGKGIRYAGEVVRRKVGKRA